MFFKSFISPRIGFTSWASNPYWIGNRTHTYLSANKGATSLRVFPQMLKLTPFHTTITYHPVQNSASIYIWLSLWPVPPHLSGREAGGPLRCGSVRERWPAGGGGGGVCPSCADPPCRQGRLWRTPHAHSAAGRPDCRADHVLSVRPTRSSSDRRTDGRTYGRTGGRTGDGRELTG